jgi:hypothetical protein
VFIEVSARTYMSICVCTWFLKKLWIDETCAFFPFYENWLSIAISLSFYSLISLKIN